jgi:uncharacterized protein (TIGR03435 family)
MQSLSHETEPDVWPQIKPLLEDAMGRLGEKERDAIILRFFERKSFQEIGVAIGASENAAKKRVSHGLEKLRKRFAQHGIASTTTALAETISANSIQFPPAALAKSVTTMALAKGAAASTSTLTLIKGALKIMAWTKAKMALVVIAGVLLAAGTTSVVISKIKSPSVDESLWEMKPENLRKAPPVLIIRPTRFSDHTEMMGDRGMISHNLDFKGLLEIAYAVTNSEGNSPQFFSPERIILPPDVPQGGYDLMFTLPNHPMEKLQQAIAQTTGFASRKEIRQTDVFLLKVTNSTLFALHVSKGGTKMNHKWGDNMRSASNQPISDTAQFLEGAFHKPVHVQPDLLGRYDFTFQWQDTQSQKEALTRQLDEAGLELVPTNMPIEILVVEKAK